MAETNTIQSFDFKRGAEAVLKTLRRDRDRQVIARRFGFDLPKRQTLEQIGRHFGITRERVRQIEKAALAKTKSSRTAEVAQANSLLTEYLQQEGGVVSLRTLSERLGLAGPAEQSYLVFMAHVAPDINFIDEDDRVAAGLGLGEQFTVARIHGLIDELVAAFAERGKPGKLTDVTADLGELTPKAWENLAGLSKQLARHEGDWGLTGWPQVNPKSIRDKTYLVLNKHGKPLHFSDIAGRIKNSNFSRRDVTVQAVHNELIKDPRFVLIGRGIYALAEWGYTPGTVADIIVDILKQEAPLHKDEIVRRVLQKRQVKTTTIVLNLQEKEHFERVAKATYKLKGQ